MRSPADQRPGDLDATASAPPELSTEGGTYATRTFDDFYASEFPRVVASVVPLAGSWAVAQEIVQEAFVDAFRRWDKVSTYDRPEMWVRRAAINRAVSTFRRRRAERRALHRRGPDSVEVAASDVDTSYAHLLELVAGLPRRQAAAISLVYVDQLTTAEAAEVMGCSMSTLRTHLEKARAHLQQILAQEDGA